MLVTIVSIGLVIYEQLPLAKDVPLRGFVQLLQGGIYLVGGLMIVATFLGVPLVYSFTALAAIFAALGFVFQDPIMGFFAGIQLAANKMVAIGDWIEAPQYGANGAVKEILMSTVKVQNWDNTVTTVPTRSLITDSFKNWRQMYASGVRRMQRMVLLDVYAVRPLTPELLAKLPTMADVWQRIGAGELPAGEILVGEAAEHPTNLGVYRVYLTDYLHRHPRSTRSSRTWRTNCRPKMTVCRWSCMRFCWTPRCRTTPRRFPQSSNMSMPCCRSLGCAPSSAQSAWTSATSPHAGA